MFSGLLLPPSSVKSHVSHILRMMQASSHYGQQHQVPFNLGGALPRASFGQYQGPVMGNQQLQHSHLPGQGFSYSSAGSQANAHLFADSQQFRNQQPAGSQAYGNHDLASQMLLQRLQQQSYSQAPQGGAGLDRFFNPLAFSNAQNAHVPAIPVSAAGCRGIICCCCSCASAWFAAHYDIPMPFGQNALISHKPLIVLKSKGFCFAYLHFLCTCRTRREACQNWKQ